MDNFKFSFHSQGQLESVILDTSHLCSKYYPSQTSVDKGFFSARFRDRWFLPAVQKFWSRDNIFAALRLAKHESRDVILVVNNQNGIT